MKPVEQTIAAPPRGDCFRACVASILELPIAECPNPPSDPDGHWWNEWIAWLETRGYELIQWTVPEDGGEQRVCGALRGYWIATAPSLNAPPPPPGRPNLGRHCVVMRGDSLVHDPSTGEKWSAEKWAEGGRIFEVTLVHPLNPVFAERSVREQAQRGEVERYTEVTHGAEGDRVSWEPTGRTWAEELALANKGEGDRRREGKEALARAVKAEAILKQVRAALGRNGTAADVGAARAALDLDQGGHDRPA